MAEDAIQVLLSEHRHLQEMLGAIEQVAAASPVDTAALLERAEAFHQALDRHERREEDVLFPALEGMGPVQLVLQEHARLRTLRDGLSKALEVARNDPSESAGAALKRKVDEVAYCLSGHMMKEEQLVFRMARAMLGPERLAEMGARMAAIS